MSLKVMHWAWSVRLGPVQKLVLLALADIADDGGFCFPSVPTLATKCTLSQRTIQRVLRRLSSLNLMSVEDRFRRDGSRTSNGYKLAIVHPPSNSHRAGDNTDTGVVTDIRGTPPPMCHQGGDSSAGVTTIEQSINETTRQPSPHDRLAELTAASRSAQAVRGLCFPAGLTAAQQESLARLITALSDCEAQRVLDELTGRLNLKQARERINDPVRYCARLVERLKCGEFHVELGRAVARDREARLVVGDHMEQRGLGVAVADAVPNQVPESFRAAARRLRAGLPHAVGGTRTVACRGESSNTRNCEK